MKSLVFMGSVIGVIFLGLLIPGGKLSNSSSNPTQDREDIREMVALYYELLRAEEYEAAVFLYQNGTFESDELQGLKVEPAKMLEMASKMSGIPDEIELVNLELYSDWGAKGDIMIQRQQIGGNKTIVMTDPDSGEKVGTFARTLYFIKEDGYWKIAKSASEVLPEDHPQYATEKELLNTLDKLHKIQDAQKQKNDEMVRKLAEEL